MLKSRPEPGRLHDSKRESVPPTPRYHVMEIGSRWRQFAEWSAYPRDVEEQGELVTEDWLVKNGPDYSQPWHAADEEKYGAKGDKRREQQSAWWRRMQRTLLRNPAIPLVLRLTVGAFSSIALGLGASTRSCLKPNTSPLMAIIVDVVALIYLIVITHDEYSGQPLGLRSAKSKVRLIMLDLFFIVFNSANLGLAFEALWSYTSGDDLCLGKQDALASVLLVVLVAWLMTFAISILR